MHKQLSVQDACTNAVTSQFSYSITADNSIHSYPNLNRHLYSRFITSFISLRMCGEYTVRKFYPFNSQNILVARNYIYVNENLLHANIA